MDLLNFKIPQWHQIDTSSVIIEENHDSLISLSAKGNPRILFEPYYYLQQIPGAINECYLRETVYTKLCEALTYLPNGYGFKIFDAWRPFEVQAFLFYNEVERLKNLENKSKEDAIELAKDFVSFPGRNPTKPFVHSTGGAIDITITDEHNNPLEMGTPFDDFSPMSYTSFFEESDYNEIKRNRKLLYAILTGVGFTNFPSEWWHFDFGDPFWAAETKENIAVYGGIYKI